MRREGPSGSTMQNLRPSGQYTDPEFTGYLAVGVHCLKFVCRDGFVVIRMKSESTTSVRITVCRTSRLAYGHEYMEGGA